MQYLITYGALALFVVVGALLFKKEQIKNSALTAKILAYILLAVFVARYYFYVEYPVDNLVGIENSPLSSKFLTVLTVINVAFMQTAFLILLLAPFYKIEFLRLLAKYFCLPAYILASLLVSQTVRIEFKFYSKDGPFSNLAYYTGTKTLFNPKKN